MPEPNAVQQIRSALDAGDIDQVRRTLLMANGGDEVLVREALGQESLDRSRQAASRRRRGTKAGKVIVLPGIMGSELDVIDSGGDADRVWLNYARLIFGRISDLKLTDSGQPASSGKRVRPVGMHVGTYLPLVLELDVTWDVHPFPFDWREDIDKAADRLASDVASFGGGDPVHLVAHSMGGLVSRRFIQRHRDSWAGMADPDDAGRGGRLVMMGTPNHGSFAVPLTLTGAEKLVRTLAKADVPHDLPEVLEILSTFLGLYQMLPSPEVDLQDDHVRLFDDVTWGSLSVRPPLLAAAKTFAVGIENPPDPKRFLYVAGYDQPTPVAVKVDAPGRFSYRLTPDGDGRVPHKLGLFADVDTYWVRESHGSLPKNGLVLDSIHDLLRTGRTTKLPGTKPAVRALDRSMESRWIPGADLEPVPPAIDTLLASADTRGFAEGHVTLSALDELRLENLSIDAYLAPGGDAGPPPPAPPSESVAVGPTTVKIGVAWGDVTRIKTDESTVHSVGHYEGVEPQRAELALDRAVSGASSDTDPRELVITQQTRRGIVRGELGEVSFFPWRAGMGPDRLVTVVGMGRPGTFDRAAMRVLVRSLLLSVGTLPGRSKLCTVLIGSGEGTLSIAEAVRGLVDAVSETLAEIASSHELAFVTPIAEILIAELERGRAAEILRSLRDATDPQRDDLPDREHQPVSFTVARSLKVTPGGGVSMEEAISIVADTVAEQATRPATERRSLQSVLDQAATTKGVKALTFARLVEAGTTGARSFRVVDAGQDENSARVPVRVSFREDGATIKAAAINHAATVSERVIAVRHDLVDELVSKLTDPPAGEVPRLSRLLHQILVPPEFREVLRSGPFVLEVDRRTARIQWEYLTAAAWFAGAKEPLAVGHPFARQIRTLYSPPPLPPRQPRRRLRALVIGDPGDPARGHSLPGARHEALRVVDILRGHGVEVLPRIGAPGTEVTGAPADVRPADRIEVLGLLLEGGFDLVHYSGHGDFDPDDPRRRGWVFASGLLSATEIGHMEQPPDLLVANACLTAQTSEALSGGRKLSDGPDAYAEADLLPSLADEFFRLGVRDYVGTAWEVSDVGAELFADVFYSALLPGDGPAETIGESVRQARQALWRRPMFGPLWAAYQHYGDPEARVREASRTDDD
jgi:hypothetical protein